MNEFEHYIECLYCGKHFYWTPSWRESEPKCPTCHEIYMLKEREIPKKQDVYGYNYSLPGKTKKRL